MKSVEIEIFQFSPDINCSDVESWSQVRNHFMYFKTLYFKVCQIELKQVTRGSFLSPPSPWRTSLGNFHNLGWFMHQQIRHAGSNLQLR